MKKIFNLAVAMSVIASSLVFSSCGDDEDDDETPKQEQNTNNNTNDNTNDNQGDKKPAAKAETSVKVAKGETYAISNTKLGVNTTMSIDKVEGSTVTVSVSGSEAITIGYAKEDKSYALLSDGDKVVLASMTDAKANPANVLFICNAEATLASGTLAASADINSKASETTFTKQ